MGDVGRRPQQWQKGQRKAKDGPSPWSYQGCVQEGLSACSKAARLGWIIRGCWLCLPPFTAQGSSHRAPVPLGHDGTYRQEGCCGLAEAGPGFLQQLPGTHPAPRCYSTPPSPLLGHLVPQGLEILPSVSACLSTPARDPRPLRQE